MTTPPVAFPITAKQLLHELRECLPNGLGTTSFVAMLPHLPYVLLPGGRRRRYFLNEVLAALQHQVLLHHNPAEERISLHRRRPRRATA